MSARTAFVTVLTASVVALTALQPSSSGATSAAAPPTRSSSVAPSGQPDDPTTALDDRADLPPGWRTSKDRLWTLSGDARGLHLLVADARDGYSWRTAATLGEAGVETDRWVGNGCVTGSGRFAVVVYAPRSFANEAALYLRGARTAIVDLDSGKVTKPDVTGSLAYFNPGCGAGDDAVLTQSRFPEESGRRTATRLYRLHAATARVDAPLERPGQLSSAVPVPQGIMATRGDAIVRVDGAGQQRVVVRHTGGAFHLGVDSAGGLVYVNGTEKANAVSRIEPSAVGAKPQVLVRQRGSWLGLDTRTGGRAVVLDADAASARSSLGHGISVVRADAREEVSSTAQTVIADEATPSPQQAKDAWAETMTSSSDTDGGTDLELTMRVLTTGDTIDFELPSGLRPSPRIGSGLRGAPAGDARGATSAKAAGPQRTLPDNPGGSDIGATCSVPRNDPKTQVYQPTPRQVEWAADQAVVGNLMTARPANWKQSGLPSWTPQVMFPNPTLRGGGRVPVQVLLGILAQESNLWQASGHALSGEFGNPLVGDFYGRGGTWSIDYSKADCGYGIGQVTDGMRIGGMSDPNMQRAIALDYETNIARSLQILVSKWNQLYDAGLLHSNGNPASIENWIYAVWAYNSGFYPNQGDGSPWGVGWFNNPANPIYQPNRGFFNANPQDAAHPSDWPYEEKVIGWAAYSISTPDGAGFRTAWWVTDVDRNRAKPPVYTFCSAANGCTPNSANPCPALDSSCWWHQSVTYNNCAQGYCGHELLRFNTTYPEQPDGTHYPPVCSTTGLPTGSIVVDDVPATAVAPRAGCGHPWTDGGTFSLDFNQPAGKIDFHQIGGGFGGHFWFAHTRTATPDGLVLQAKGTWSFTRNFANQWGRVLVHMPDHGAETQQAAYTIDRGDGTKVTRYAQQRIQANKWVDLGVLKFNGQPSVTLSSTTWDGIGNDDVAWDAVAIQPLSAKPSNIVVALGDSFSSGEGANDSAGGDDYYEETDFGGSYGKDDPRRNACHRSPWAWSRKATLLDDTTRSIGARSDAFDPTMDFHLLACSGAESENLLPYHHAGSGPLPENAEGQEGSGLYGEVSQMDKGYLDSATTLVMLSIGGNDAQFGPVITDCVNPLDLGADCTKADTTGDGPNDVAIPALIRGDVRESVETVVQQIHALAPNAKILLMGYPQLFSDGGSCAGAGGVSSAEASWIDDMSTVMDNTLATLVADLKLQGLAIEIGAPIGDFYGRGVCGNPESINGITANRTDGDPPFSGGAPASAQSFHPNIAGTTLYAAAAVRAIRTLGY